LLLIVLGYELRVFPKLFLLIEKARILIAFDDNRRPSDLSKLIVKALDCIGGGVD